MAAVGEAIRADLAAEVAPLLSKRNADGLWEDFQTLAGLSDEWPSGYIGWQLLRMGIAPEKLCTTEESLLSRQREDGGWGYNQTVPTDADSTAYVLLYLIKAGADPDAIGRGLSCLAMHQHANGGVATYATERDIRRFMALDRGIGLQGWCQPHLEVTAAAGLAFAYGGRPDRAQRCWDYVRAARALNGFWTSYWWTEPRYPTWLALELAKMVEEGVEPYPPALPQIPQGAGAFAHALALLCEGPNAALTARLQALRKHDGLWDGGPCLQIPPPHVVEPRTHVRWRREGLGTGVVISDHNGLYTTATALAALWR